MQKAKRIICGLGDQVTHDLNPNSNSDWSSKLKQQTKLEPKNSLNLANSQLDIKHELES